MDRCGSVRFAYWLISVREYVVSSMLGGLIVKAHVVPAKISPEVVLLLIQTSHRVVTLVILAAKLEHAESLADAALLAGELVLYSLVVTAAELLFETSSTAEASR